jgi:SAM-dependent methyltransferase
MLVRSGPISFKELAMAITKDHLNALLCRAVGDLGAAASAVLICIGDELGIYRALAKEHLTPAQLAEKIGMHERYVREWLGNQAAGGYVEREADSGKYFLTDEQALCLADPTGPVDGPSAYEIVRDLFHVRSRASEDFRAGRGMEWEEHDAGLFHGTERFFRAAYNANLIGSWLPSLDGVAAKLQQGALAADVGCGHGASTILMAHAYPKSAFFGYDYHEASIRVARERAAAAGLPNVRFEVADACGYKEGDFDLIAFFDCLHDMADPVGAARHARNSLNPNGTCMIVEPIAGDCVQDNMTPVGRVYYRASSLNCVPVSLARNGAALGTQAGERRLRNVVANGGGFSHFRRATQTPFNLVFEARP